MIIATAEILKENEIENMLHTLLNCWEIWQPSIQTASPNILFSWAQFPDSHAILEEPKEFLEIGIHGIQSFPPTPSTSDTAQADLLFSLDH